MEEATCCAISEFISVLSNPTRIRILCALFPGEKSVGEIAESIGLAHAHTSAHLRVLYDRGYVSRHRNGKKVYYAIRDPRVPGFLTGAADLAVRHQRSSTTSNATIPH